MTVAELVDKLSVFPEDFNVSFLYGGLVLADVGKVWLSESGGVVLSRAGDPIYCASDRPVAKGCD